MESEQLKLCVEEALPDQAPIQPASENGKEPSPSPQGMVRTAFFACNLAMTVYSINTVLEAISIEQLLTGYILPLDFLLLFNCLSLYKRTATGSPDRQHLKLVLWLLTTMIILVIFAWMTMIKNSIYLLNKNQMSGNSAKSLFIQSNLCDGRGSHQP